MTSMDITATRIGPYTNVTIQVIRITRITCESERLGIGDVHKIIMNSKGANGVVSSPT